MKTDNRKPHRLVKVQNLVTGVTVKLSYSTGNMLATNYPNSYKIIEPKSKKVNMKKKISFLRVKEADKDIDLAYSAFRTNEELNEDLLNRLATGTAVFLFKKKDGEIRIAKGTLKPELIPDATLKVVGRAAIENYKVLYEAFMSALTKKDDRTPAHHEALDLYKEKKEELADLAKAIDKALVPKADRLKPQNTQTYFDLDACQFRSFDMDRLIGIIDV